MLLLAAPLSPWQSIPLVVALMFGGQLLGSLIGGWFRLARRYRTKAPMPEQHIRWVTVRVGIAYYKGAVTLGGDESGLYLKMMFLGFLTHPPLLIPWSELRGRRRERYFFGTYFDRFEVGPDRIVVRFEAPIMDGFSRYLSIQTQEHPGARTARARADKA